MLKPARPTLILLAAATALVLGACKKKSQGPAPAATAPQLALTPSATARADMAAEIVLPSFDKTLESVGTTAKKLQLPFGAAELRQMLFAKSPLPPAVMDKIDQSKPISIVVFAGPKDAASGARSTEAALGFALKDTSKAGFDAFVAALGKVVETQKDAVKVQPGDAAGMAAWLISRDGTVIGAEKLPALIAGGTLAIEARRAAATDVHVNLFPEGLARANGTTLKEALDKAKQGLAQGQAEATKALAEKDPKLQADAGKLMQSVGGWVLDAVADTTEARIALGLDPNKGLSSSFEVVPRPGSPLAKTVNTRKAYAVDPALLSGTSPGALWAMGDISLTRNIWNSMRDVVLGLAVPEAERPKVNATIDALFDALSGPASTRFNFEPGPKLNMAYDVIYGLKPGTDGKKLMADIEALMKAPWLAKLFDAAMAGMVKVKLANKRDGDALVTQIAFDTSKSPPAVRKEFKNVPFFDGKPIEGRTVIDGERMLISTGSNSKARLQALRAASPATPTGDLAAALGETKGDDGVYYMDLAALFRPLASLAASGGLGKGGGGGPDPAAMAGMASAMLKDAHLAMWGSYRGGETFTIGWRVPMSTFESVAVIARGAMGMGGAPQ